MFNSTNGMPFSMNVVPEGGNNSGWGDGSYGGWFWIIIILVLCWGGFGNGFGGYGNATANGLTDGYILTSDFANIERKIDGVNNGICSLGYDQLAQMNGINQNVSNTGYNLESAIMQTNNALSSQLSSCCCENRQNIADVKYTLATDTCALNTNMSNLARDIIDNDNANYRAINDRLTNMEMNAKDSQIAELNAQIQTLNLAASQAAQNNYLLSELRPNARPAYITCSPYQSSWGAGCSCV